MKTSIIKTALLFSIIVLNSMKADCQTTFHQTLNNLYEDTAVTHFMTMTYDNSGNTFYAARAEYQFDDGNFISDVGIKLWKRSTTGVSSGNIFYKYSSSGGNDRVVKMIYTGSALYVLVQGQYDLPPNDRDVLLLKYNSSMVFQWSRLYNGVGNPHDDAIDITPGPSGSILILVKSLNNIITVRYSAAGAVMNTGVFDSGVGNEDTPSKVLYANNATYVCGTRPAATGRQSVLIKYNNTLVQQWALLTKSSVGATNDVNTDMTIDTSGNVYVAGTHFNTATRPFIYKVNPAGTRLWLRKLTFNGMSPMRIFTDNNAQPFLYGNASPDRYLRLDKVTGATALNVIMFNNPNQHFDVFSVDKGSTNDIYLTGNFDTTYFDPNFGNNVNSYGYRVIKINNAANRVWTINNISLDAHFTYHPVQIAVRGNSKVYYGVDQTFVGFPFTHSEEYVTIHGVNPANGMREEEVEETTSTEKLTVYPNPATDKINFNFNCNSDHVSLIELYNISGQLVNSILKGVVKGYNELQLGTAGLQNGIYILKVTSGGKQMEERVLISN